MNLHIRDHAGFGHVFCDLIDDAAQIELEAGPCRVLRMSDGIYFERISEPTSVAGPYRTISAVLLDRGVVTERDARSVLLTWGGRRFQVGTTTGVWEEVSDP